MSENATNQIDLNKIVLIKNLCNWDIYMRQLSGISSGSIRIKANASKPMTWGEVILQVEEQNKFFAWNDNGDHPKVYIQDDELRKYLGFDKQKVLTEDKVKKIIEYKTMETFKKHVEENVVRNHEKINMIKWAKKHGLNDFDKISYLEEYCGYNFRD